MVLVISNILKCWVMTEEFIGTVKNCPVVKRRTKIIIIKVIIIIVTNVFVRKVVQGLKIQLY